VHALFVQNNDKEKISKEIKEKLINKVNFKNRSNKNKDNQTHESKSIVKEFETRSDL